MPKQDATLIDRLRRYKHAGLIRTQETKRFVEAGRAGAAANYARIAYQSGAAYIERFRAAKKAGTLRERYPDHMKNAVERGRQARAEVRRLRAAGGEVHVRAHTRTRPGG